MINFPSSPIIGQTFVAAGDTWTWDGVKWTGGGAAASAVVIPVQEAPEDGLQYGRQNGVWSPITATTVGIADVTAGGQYVRVTGAWQPLILPASGIPEAPASGGPYARQSSSWLQLGVLATALDAPSGSSTVLYGRVNGTWSAVPAAGIPDAPSGGPYCRIPGAWTPVPASTGITDAPSGGPYARTAGSWVTIAPTTGTYIPLSGGTITGPIISPDTSPLVSANYVAANTPAPGSYLATSGGVMTGLLVMTANAVVGGAAGTQRVIFGETGNVPRWGLVLGNSDGEGGSSSGSNFQLVSYSDSGTATAALVVNRASSATTINAVGATPVSAAFAAGQCNLSLNKAGSGRSNQINGYSNGVIRWQITLGNTTTEDSSNSGSGFSIQNFNNAGAALTSPPPLQIGRASGVCVFAAAIQNGPSDRRLKENIEPLEGSLAKVWALQGVSFNMIATPEKREIGLIAQDVQPIVPEVIQEIIESDKLGIDYPKLTALLIEALKELSVKVETLEAKIDALEAAAL